MESALLTDMQKCIALLVWAGAMCAGVAAGTSANPCCLPGRRILPSYHCQLEMERINLNCTEGHLLVRHAIFHGDKLLAEDTPGFVYAEDPRQYCVGEMSVNVSDPDAGTLVAAVACFQPAPSSHSDFETSGVLTLTSVLFLVLTIAVYTLLPGLRDLQGLCYMCMCISMALGFLSLGILQLRPGFEGEICTVTGFLVYFWMMATFFWMNVICINMYRTVNDASYLRRTENKQYAIYSCYAWGATFFLLTISLMANFIEGDHLKPGIGKNSCWFSGRAETWLFFYGPVAILISVNVVLFILSSYNLWQHTNKYEVNKLNNLKRKFLLSLKLFLVMGISWTFEIASFAHGEAHIVWKIMDTVNCLQGVIIFLLLVVFRRRVLRGLVSENCCLVVTRPLADRMGTQSDTDDQQMLGEDLNNMEVRLN